MEIIGTTGNDSPDGTGGADTFLLFQGGNDTATGDAGNDVFGMRDSLTAADAIDGGADFDTVRLIGDYSAGLTLGASTLVNVELLQLKGAFSYNLTMDDGNVAAGEVLTVNARFIGGALTFDGSAETDGSFLLRGGAGDDVLTGGWGNDTFWFARGGSDIANGGVGDDTFRFSTTFTAADSIDGGKGNDTVAMHGGASLTFGATTMVNVEKLVVNTDAATTLITDDATVAAGDTLTVAVRKMSSVLTFDGSAETNGTLHVIGGNGGDTLIGGSGDDTFQGLGGNDIINGGGGADTLRGGSGNDTFVYSQTSDSPGDTYAHIDQIAGFDATGDLLQFPFVVNFIKIVSGVANDLPDIATVVDPWVEAGSHGAVLVDVTGGTLGGLKLLFVDFNNDGSYSGAADVVIDITGINNPLNLGSGDFIT